MPTLLMRLQGPMQSWGSRSRFTERDTEREPTKSGVLGVLAAALGRHRDEPLDDLRQLLFGVRVDRPGRLERDFHTAQGALKANKNPVVSREDSWEKARDYLLGRLNQKPVANISNRYYLADAVFLVGLEGDDRAFLEQLNAALRDPVWTLYLGRKAFPPTRPIALPEGQGVVDGDREAAFKQTPWFGQSWREWAREQEAPDHNLTIALETDITDPTRRTVRKDQPLRFESRYRRFDACWLRYKEIPCPQPEPPLLQPRYS